jgi:streptogramin lyase
MFGCLEVVGRHKGKVWRCLCICGNERVIYVSNLISGAATHCGCLHRITGCVKKPQPKRAVRWSPEHRAKLSAAAKRRYASETERQNRSEAAWRRYQRPGERAKASDRMREQIAKHGHPARRKQA